jgi:hypothetical protein
MDNQKMVVSIERRAFSIPHFEAKESASGKRKMPLFMREHFEEIYVVGTQREKVVFIQNFKSK